MNNNVGVFKYAAGKRIYMKVLVKYREKTGK